MKVQNRAPTCSLGQGAASTAPPLLGSSGGGGRGQNFTTGPLDYLDVKKSPLLGRRFRSCCRTTWQHSRPLYLSLTFPRRGTSHSFCAQTLLIDRLPPSDGERCSSCEAAATTWQAITTDLERSPVVPSPRVSGTPGPQREALRHTTRRRLRDCSSKCQRSWDGACQRWPTICTGPWSLSDHARHCGCASGQEV